jgi:hypothetical protein
MENHEHLGMPGGWTPYHHLTPEDKKVFEIAMHGFVGVKYTPLDVSTQVVAGVNYRFVCDAVLPSGGTPWIALVSIFKPLNGDPYVTEIHRI